MRKKINWRKYAFEFLSIFVAVISAFALNNWNDNRRDNIAESKILSEILNGLEKDIKDVDINLTGHEQGIDACKFWRRIINDEAQNTDTLARTTERDKSRIRMTVHPTPPVDAKNTHDDSRY